MSDNSLTVVEVAYDPNDDPVIHVDGWAPIQAANMQSVSAEGLDTYMITSNVASAVVASTKAEIKERIDAGSSNPVLKSHLDALGITNAVKAWASD